MRRLTLLIILFSLNLSATAEENLIRAKKKLKSEINFNTGNYFESNALTNEFFTAHLLGQFIDDEMKDGVSDNLSSMNRFGIESNAELKYVYNDSIFKLANSFFSFALRNRYHINSQFSEDVFELYFRGNKNYEDKTADLDDFIFNQIFYQQFNVTFGRSFKAKESMIKYSIGLSLNKGQKLYQIEAPRASIYTATLGRYLDLDANLILHQSDSSADKIESWKGTGGAIDFNFGLETKKHNVVLLRAENFGFIQWNAQSAFVSADTSLRFEGIDVSYLFDFADTIKKSISLDSSLVQPYLNEREKKPYTTPIPAFLSLSYKYIIKPNKMDVTAEASYLFFANPLPLGSITYGYWLYSRDKMRHQISLKARYGNYDKFELGLGYKVNFNGRWELKLQSDYLLGIIKGKSGTAQGAFLSLSSYF